MRKIVSFLFVLSILTVACEKDKDPKTETQEDLSYISKTFKSIKVIHDNLGSGSEKTLAELLSMYKTDIKPNVAGSVSADFEAWIPKIREGEEEAEKGKAGKIGKRYVNEKGVEVAQLVKKGFIGAFQLNGFNLAMREAVTAVEKSKRKAALDKAVTFLLGDISYLDKSKVDGKYPVYDGNQFVYYMNKVGDMGDQIYKAIKNAYSKTGDVASFKNALLEINKLVTKTVAIRGVHYLKHAAALQNGYDVEEAHELSEGLGFCYSLQFAYKGMGQFYMTKDSAKALTELDLWDKNVTPVKIEAKAKQIAGMFKFDYNGAK